MAVDLQEVRRDLIIRYIERNYEYSESILKWCVTTLAALNGGALIALIGIEDFRTEGLEDIVWFFGIGVFSAVLATFCFGWAYAGAAQDIAERLWKDDILSSESYKAEILKGDRDIWPMTIALVTMITSVVMLVLGSLKVMEFAASA